MPTDYLFYSDGDLKHERTVKANGRTAHGYNLSGGTYLASDGCTLINDGVPETCGPIRAHRDRARQGWWIVRAGTTSIVVDGAEIDLTRLGEGYLPKVGDVVRLSVLGEESYLYQAEGHIGTVTEAACDKWWRVTWGNGYRDVYKPEHLVLAPVKCSCSHEAGDSACDAHPTCWNCGEPATRRDAMCEPCEKNVREVARIKPAPPQPERPSDAAICAAWEAEMQRNEARLSRDPRAFADPWETPPSQQSVSVNGIATTLTDYRKARSRLLRAKAEAAREAERLVVLVDIDDEEYA